MAEVWIMGEMIVEIMRTEVGASLKDAGVFKGPYPSGAPAIFIDTVARLGHSAGIIGGVGKDDFGQCLLERLTKDGVDCSKVIQSDRFATGVAFVTYFNDGSRQFIFHMGNTPAVEPKAPNIEDLAGIKYFHVMGCSLMAEENFAAEIVKTLHLARQAGAKISFDPNIRKELLRGSSAISIVKEVFEHTNIFMPGIDELLMITEQTTVEEAIAKCFENPKLEWVVLKKGSKGSTIYSRNETSDIGIFPVEVVDTTGAGDSFDGAFISSLLDNKSIQSSAIIATAAAALNTSALGPMEGMISQESIDRFISSNTLSKNH